MTVRERIDITLDQQVTLIDATARDAGHQPHPWVHDEVGVAHTACRRCGRTAAVRVRMDSVWSAGQLRSQPCTTRRPS